MSKSKLHALAIPALLCASVAQADPKDSSCQFLQVLGSNDVDAVENLIQTVAPHWSEEARGNANTQISQLLSVDAFAGGSIYPSTKLGEDFEEHILVLRQRNGELSAVRLNYEWSPNGLQLTRFDFKRRISEITENTALGQLSSLECPDI